MFCVFRRHTLPRRTATFSPAPFGAHRDRSCVVNNSNEDCNSALCFTAIEASQKESEPLQLTISKESSRPDCDAANHSNEKPQLFAAPFRAGVQCSSSPLHQPPPLTDTSPPLSPSPSSISLSTLLAAPPTHFSTSLHLSHPLFHTPREPTPSRHFTPSQSATPIATHAPLSPPTSQPPLPRPSTTILFSSSTPSRNVIVDRLKMMPQRKTVPTYGCKNTMSIRSFDCQIALHHVLIIINSRGRIGNGWRIVKSLVTHRPEMLLRGTHRQA